MKKTIAFCGTRGIPANYGGFETAVDEITAKLVDQDVECHVFCRTDQKQQPSSTVDGRKTIYIKGSASRKLDTFVSAINTGLYLLKHRKEYDYVFWFNNANLPGILLTLLAGIPTAVNTDGLEWRRAKWSWPFKLYYFLSSWMVTVLCKTLVSDSSAIQRYYWDTFGTRTEMVPYGIPKERQIDDDLKRQVLEKYDLQENKFFLQITRFEPDNLPLDIIKGFIQSGIWEQGYKYVLIGYKDDTPYSLSIKQLSGEHGVCVHPANYNALELATLRKAAFGYVHGNSVGGTNPALIEAMQSCKRIMAIKGPFSDEVLHGSGLQFTVQSLAEDFKNVLSMPEQSAAMQQRVNSYYNWSEVASSYLRIANGERANYNRRIIRTGVNTAQVGSILVNYNGYQDSVECIQSLIRLNYNNQKIYVVDNASPDSSGTLLESYIRELGMEQIEFFQLKENLGFSGGNNVAIRKAIQDGCDYIWLINNDTVVHEDALTHLVHAAESDPNAGIVGSKIYFYKSPRLWFAGGRVNKMGICGHIGDSVEDPDNKLYAESKEVDFITGCSLLARVDMVNQIGLLDEEFFLYFEDVEFNIRAKRSGWKLLYEPASLIWHKVSASTKGQYRDHAPIVDYYDTRNYLIFINKCYSKFNRLLPYAGFVYKFIKKHARLMLRKESNKFKKIQLIYAALLHVVTNKKGKLSG
ncbi:DUF1972 domain-containing protein [Paenibacillus kobensis]|uniref:DUF1972 domain-containing protein n=1 Tax=Paenibacillus kobensis TaxID=59841 RepID=UPI000FD86444|nr:DUF1972 domain-containing protein [Paenibacillus kobensis]